MHDSTLMDLIPESYMLPKRVLSVLSGCQWGTFVSQPKGKVVLSVLSDCQGIYLYIPMILAVLSFMSESL